MTRAALVLALALSACGVSQATVTALEADLSREREDLQATRALRQTMEAYVRNLKTGKFNAPYSFVYLGPGDLLRAISTYFPYRTPARDLFPGGSGELEVVSVNQPRLEARNRIRLQLTLAGRDLQSGDEASRKAVEALAAGAVADLEVAVTYDAAHRFAALRPACSSVTLKRNNDPATRSQVLALLNRTLFDRSIPVPVPPLGSQPAEAIFLTGDHVVVQYRQ